ncbi:MAG: shikimate dehydrogenase [Parasphingorhabdus sp.]
MTVSYAEVIGDPINHSKSPAVHGFWLRKLGIEAEYRAHHVQPEKLPGYIKKRQDDPSWRGCNVTLPHKVAVMDLVSDPGLVKDSIGAMNTIIRQKDGSLIGTNTDAAGFFAPLANSDWKGAHAVVIGAGGAARAVLFALKQAGIENITILARNGLKASGVMMQSGLKGDILSLDAALPNADLLINTSPLGMVGQPELEVDLSPLPDHALVYDIVYTPLETNLLKAAKSRNLDIVDGLDMFIGQAALAFEFFFGQTPPMDHDEELRKLLTA